MLAIHWLNLKAAQHSFLFHFITGGVIGVAKISGALLLRNYVTLSYHARHEVIHQRIDPDRCQRSKANHFRRRFFLYLKAPTPGRSVGPFEEKRHFAAWAPTGNGLLEGVTIENGPSQAWPFRLLPAASTLAKGAVAGGASAEPPDLKSGGALSVLRHGGRRCENCSQQDSCEKRKRQRRPRPLMSLIRTKHRSSFVLIAFHLTPDREK